MLESFFTYLNSLINNPYSQITVTFPMRIGYLFGIIIFLFSCKEAPIVVLPLLYKKILDEVDSAPPIIEWIFFYSDYNKVRMVGL